MQLGNLDQRYFFPEVLQVVAGADFTVYAYMNDGSVRLYDAKPLLKSGTVFEQLMDEHVFRSKLAVINYTVAWDMGGNRDPEKCVDIDPFAVFAAPMVSDPLEQ